MSSAVVAVITNETPLKLVALSAMVRAFAVELRLAQSDWIFFALLFCDFLAQGWLFTLYSLEYFTLVDRFVCEK